MARVTYIKFGVGVYGGVVGVYGVMVGLGVRCVAVWCVFMGVRGVMVYVYLVCTGSIAWFLIYKICRLTYISYGHK